MSDEYTPSAPAPEYIREVYAKAESAKYGHAVCDTEYKEFDAMMAAHDQALREQIAQKIEVEMRRHDNSHIGFSAVGDAYAHAARIVREGA